MRGAEVVACRVNMAVLGNVITSLRLLVGQPYHCNANQVKQILGFHGHLTPTRILIGKLFGKGEVFYSMRGWSGLWVGLALGAVKC
jgi:hypothetical protein